MPDLHLGLIGDNIARSSAPSLHRMAGQQNGLDVQYDRLVPADLGQPFEQVFENCRNGPYAGLNITYPYKEIAARGVLIDNEQVRRIGAVNTVVFTDQGPRGYNTDYTGFLAAYHKERGHKPPGTVLLVGAGGVGRAVAFALVTLGAREIRLFDCSQERAHSLAVELRAAAPADTIVSVARTVEELAPAVDGLINCTPVGMVGRPGTAIPAEIIPGAEWAFDAVYTPVETQFILDADAAGLQIISGYELFFFQGVNAWEFFCGLPIDQDRLRMDLLQDAHRAPDASKPPGN